MSKIKDYCRKLDTRAPDYFSQMQKKNWCREGLTNPNQMNKEVTSVVNRLVEAYEKKYVENYLSVFEDYFKFREPLIINLDKSEVSEHPQSELFCYSMFVKPGKNEYVIRTPEG